MGKYNFELDMEMNDTNPIIINQVESNSKILEFGSANGRMTKYLKEEKKCSVDIVEIDIESGKEASKYADNYCIGNEEGNIENFIWIQKFSKQKYDYILFADVLEHLSKPKEVLEVCRNFLKDDGKIIVSIPNMAHNAIISELFMNNFEYHETGLLDNTHIKFFTYNSFKNMADDLDMYIINEEAVYHHLEDTEFEILSKNIPTCVKKALTTHKYGTVYQWIFTLSLQDSACLNKVKPLLENFYQLRIYYSQLGVENFNVEQSVVFNIDLDSKILNIEYEIPANTICLRIDPINTNGIIKIEKIILKDNESEYVPDYDINGYYFGDKKFVLFDSLYPQILIKRIPEGTKKLILSLKYLDCDNEELAKMAVLLRNYQNDMMEKENLLERSQIELKNKIEIVGIQEKQIKEQEKQIKEQEEQIKEQEEQIRKQGEQIKEQERIIYEKTIIINDREKLIEDIYNSFSWKLTEPYRKIRKFFEKERKKDD